MSATITISSATVTIAAPAQLVWQVLTDFAQYPQWNRFCPSIEARLELGSPVKMKVDLGQGLQDQVEYITCLEPPRKITWSMENKPGDPIHADRSQVVEPVDENHCTYVTYDVFSGEAASQMVEMLGQPVEDGFNLCAQNIKARAEMLYQQQRDAEDLRGS
jgi:uncharacterized protein YndB with AHSA1/START domain